MMLQKQYIYSNLVEVCGGQRVLLTGDNHYGVAPDNSRREEGDKCQQRIVIGTSDPNHTNGLIDTNCASVESGLLCVHVCACVFEWACVCV